MNKDTKGNILLVEDEENLHEALKLNLEMEGYGITSAFTGTQALKAIQNEYFDFVIMDIMLPEIDGISVTENIRVQHLMCLFYFECKKYRCRPGIGFKKRR